RVVGTRSLLPQVLDTNTALKTACDVIVVGPDLDKSTGKALLQGANHHGVLTICDECGRFAEHSIITLTRHNDRIGFEVDTGTAQANGLLFSSALLELALRVTP
ncbi:MAG: YfiR family protein, partial [Gammaproteobacteria bacterium]|nr:YfiR family protein [Gammaproteobacteria bacterium]